MRPRSRLDFVPRFWLAPILLPTAGCAAGAILQQTVQQAAQDEARALVEDQVRSTIRCAVDDPACAEQAEASGDEVVYVDESGEVITDEAGEPITDRDRALSSAPAAGDGIWANYDFVPGDRILFYDDYSNDRVGDFPRRFELIKGTWDVVEVGARRYLRATSDGSVRIPLPETLPDRFTIEFDASLLHGNGRIVLTPEPSYQTPDRSYSGSAPQLQFTQAGLHRVGDGGPEALARHDHDFDRGVASFRIMGDGEYLKIYLDEQRVANVPNAIFPRTEALYLATSWASEERPTLIGPTRVAAGGRDLYDRLSSDGRAVTRGILFATDSERIRGESTPTLDEIATMLDEHPDLRLAIEGHTDATGDEAHNEELSERRAAAVKAFLVERRGIDASRLETTGFGAARPAADNSTPQGRQQNRRVELVRLPVGSP